MDKKTPIEEYAEARMSGGQRPEEETPKDKTSIGIGLPLPKPKKENFSWKGIITTLLVIGVLFLGYKVLTMDQPPKEALSEVADEVGEITLATLHKTEDQGQVRTEPEMREDIVHPKEMTQAQAAVAEPGRRARVQRAETEPHQILQVHA